MGKKTNDFRVMTFFANKGGNAKTTSSLMFAAILEMKGYRVLLIDNDGQSNASFFTGAPLLPRTAQIRTENLYEKINKDTPNMNQMLDKALIREAIQMSEIGYDYIESSKKLDMVVPTDQTPNMAKTLWRIRQVVKNNYDFCIIDSPCKADVLCANGLIAADDVILTISTEADTEKTLVNNSILFKELEKRWDAKANIDRVIPVKIKTPSHVKELLPVIEAYSKKQYGCKVSKNYIKYSADIENCMSAKEYRIECIKSGRSSDAFIAYIENVEEYLRDHGYEDDSPFTVLSVNDMSGKLKKKIVTDVRDVAREYTNIVKAFLKAEGLESNVYIETNLNSEDTHKYKVIVELAKGKGKNLDATTCKKRIVNYLEEHGVAYIVNIKEAKNL